jgi:hypothetical protein
LRPEDQPGLVEAAELSPHWIEVYQDDNTVIFTRR